MDRGAWRATAHGVSKSWTQLSDSHIHSFLNLEFPEKLLADANISSYLAEKISHYK